MRKVYATVLAGALALAACTKQDDTARERVASSDSTTTLTCLAGSEVSDVAPMLEALRKETGVTIRLVSAGTLSSVEILEASPTKYDCGWFSHNKYLMLNPQVKGLIKASERIMVSPVAIGVKAAKAKQLGWTTDNTTWADIAKASKDGRFRFAMTSPASSNTGMSALIGVTAALAGADAAITTDTIRRVELSGFGKGQVLFSDSSGWLTTAFQKSLADPAGPEGMINYESELLKLNTQQQAGLTLIYPKEGIVTADYPLMLFNEGKRASFDKAVAFLRNDETQAWLMANTYRRPVSATVKPDAAMFGTHMLVEVPFPGNAAVLDELITSYLDKQRRPGHVYFVLDTSGSMGGNGGIGQLRTALQNLAGSDASLTGRYSRFRLREKVTVIEFAGNVKQETTYDMGATMKSMSAGLNALGSAAEVMNADGGTAIFSAVARAVALAEENSQSEPGYIQSIVVMTDGLSNEGMSAREFERFYRSRSDDAKRVRIFGVLFGGGASREQIQSLADVSGGAVFDGSDSLSGVFKKIRGYQ
ncbi:VWA domain-containing protein [Cupriavidus necator]